MTWTYTNNPSTVPLDQLRLLIGDTNSAVPLMTDEELNYFLNTYNNNVWLAAAQAARSIAAEYAKMSNKSVGGLSIDYSQKYQQYMTLYQDLMTASNDGNITGINPVPVLGGGGQTYLGGKWP